MLSKHKMWDYFLLKIPNIWGYVRQKDEKRTPMEKSIGVFVTLPWSR